MKIKKIELENFGKFDKWEWDIPEKKVVVVTGKNGSGKSTAFVESLLWALYDSSWKDINADTVIGDDKDVCSATLVTDSGIIVKRKQRKASSSILWDGRQLTKEAYKEAIKISKDTFLNSVIFGGGLSGFLNLSEKDRKEVVAEYIYNSIDEIIAKLKDKVKEREKEKLLLNNEINGINNKVAVLQSKLKENSMDYSEGEIELLKKEIDKKKENIETINKMLLNITNEIEDLEQSKGKIFDSLLVLRNELKGLIYKIASLENNISELQKQSNNINGLTICPVCLQEVSGEHKEKVAQEIEDRINGFYDELKEWQEKKEDIDNIIKDAELKVKRIQDTQNEKREYYKKEMEGIASINKEIEGLSIKVAVMEKSREIKNMLEKEIQELDVELKRLQDNIIIIEDKVNAGNWWVERLTEYKVEIFKKVLEKFSKVVNEFLIRLTNRFTVNLNYDVKGSKRISEKLELKILDKGREVELGRLSNGEKRLVTLALNLCFNYVSNLVFAKDWNIIVFDEVFDGLDTGVREKVIDLLLDIVDEMDKTIILITHDDFNYRENEIEYINMGVIE